MPIICSVQHRWPFRLIPFIANDNPDYWGGVGDMANPVHVSDSEYSGNEDRLRREFNGSLALTMEIPRVKRVNC